MIDPSYKNYQESFPIGNRLVAMIPCTEQNMMDEINHHDGPLYDDELKEKYSNAKKYAIEYF